MKKLFFLLISVFVSCIGCKAQAVSDDYEYKPLLTEGKMWKVVVKDGGLHPDRYETYMVSGDTVVDGRNCKRVVFDNGKCKEYTAAYEENNKFYSYNFGAMPSLMLDFGLERGELARDCGSDTENNLYVSDVDYIEVNGVLRKRIIIKSQIFGTFYWVDGIGTDRELWADPAIGAVIGENSYLYECYENGKLIFSQSDFTKASDVGRVWQEKKIDDSCRYTIDGTCIGDNGKCGIYIQNGKKYIKK